MLVADVGALLKERGSPSGPLLKNLKDGVNLRGRGQIQIISTSTKSRTLYVTASIVLHHEIPSKCFDLWG